jgi:LruC domain-containing protein
MQNSSTKFKWLFILTIFSIVSCKKNDTSSTGTTSISDTSTDALTNLQVPDGFNFRTDQQVQINISLLAPNNTPITNIPVSILDQPVENGGRVLFSGISDGSGRVSGTVNLPAYYTYVIIDPAYIGIMRNAVVNIEGSAINCTIGGSAGYSGNVVPNSPLGVRIASYAGNMGGRTMSNPPYKYMGTFNSDGVPNYLETPNDVISSQLLSFVNASLPEHVSVMTSHPDFLSSSSETNIHLTQTSDVWFTFVSEGAGYRSSIAYFTYPTSTPPQSPSDIDSLHIILPNASLGGSGGGLTSGNKVKLGRFNAGTSVGFALLADAWNGTNVGTGLWTLYSLDNLNPESQTNLKRHTVLLYNQNSNQFVVGFEDIRRDYGSCDNDFNDVVFYVTSNPPSAINRTNVNPIDQPVDTDGDGVSDIYDKFPNDPTRAYINSYPSKNGYGTLAFEDNWPFKGDYDLNDLVVDYNYTLITNAQNSTVEIDAEYVLKAMGATYKNGFGVQFPFASSVVQSVTGTRVTNSGVVTLASNGCEAGQSKAVIIPFDDATLVSGQNSFVNTYLGNNFHTPDTIRMKINLNTPVTAANMGTIPYNPFIIINRTRGREAHLAGYVPTDKVNSSYFKTGQDNTVPSQNKYYKTSTNLPWGIGFTETFKYPLEAKPINTAYTKFVPWAQAGGSLNTNWYKDSVHMVNANIYHR